MEIIKEGYLGEYADVITKLIENSSDFQKESRKYTNFFIKGKTIFQYAARSIILTEKEEVVAVVLYIEYSNEIEIVFAYDDDRNAKRVKTIVNKIADVGKKKKHGFYLTSAYNSRLGTIIANELDLVPDYILMKRFAK